MALHPRWSWPARALLALALLVAELPALASSLAAWGISRQGVLELRTGADVSPQAFYEAGSGDRGPRVWIDLPGAPGRTRVIRGNGPIQEVRIGRPDAATTRLVLEFAPGTRINPADLRLVGTARDRWRMELRGLDRRLAFDLGEGDLTGTTVSRSATWTSRRPVPTSRTPLSADGLPTVSRGRYLVVLDPGHGGPDPGAVGIGGLRETDVVLDVALQVARLLQARGVQVMLTRTTEVDVDLPPRVAMANSAGATLFVSLHANALSMARPDVNGVETFYFAGGPGGSQALAGALQQRLMAVSPGTPDRGVKAGRFFVIRRAVMPSALVEMGFVTGAIDAPRLASPDFRRSLAQALAAGILDALGGR
jgi:N-acetylmuramoyl-L-alanine amidase